MDPPQLIAPPASKNPFKKIPSQWFGLELVVSCWPIIWSSLEALIRNYWYNWSGLTCFVQLGYLGLYFYKCLKSKKP